MHLFPMNRGLKTFLSINTTPAIDRPKTRNEVNIDLRTVKIYKIK